MTPKEKAQQLFDKMHEEQTTSTLSRNVAAFKQAKQCALIAVDEILKAESLVYGDDGDSGIYFNDFWNEVKQEINKL